MHQSASRRELLGLGGSALVGALAGCSSLADVFPESPAAEPDSQAQADEVAGRIERADGQALPGATVEALGRGGEVLSETTAGGDGRFSLGLSRPVWLRASTDGFRDRVRIGEPGGTNRITLPPGEATILRFGGDVMFGRRFYEEPTDHRIPRVQFGSGDPLAEHRRALSYVSPLLRSADLTSVNLETPLTRSRQLHPTKQFAYTSDPVAAEALAAAGVDYAALGNNHAFDALDSGLVDTTESLTAAGVAFSGAGLSPEAAWEPATVETAGLTVALLSCTTIAGQQYDLDWSADRGSGGTHTVDTGGGTVTVPDDVGVAEAAASRLSARVAAATERADIVVVQIHGGEPYQRRPTPRMEALTRTATEAGADLVVNHHPHVVGGVERLDGTVVAWSLGNLVFDQKLWVTFPTYLLGASVTADGVTGVTVDPVLIDGFVPKGAVGEPNRWVAWTAASLSDETVGVTDSGLAYRDRNATAWREQSRTFAGDGGIYARERGWVAGVEGGAVDLGRDLLPTGAFESSLVDGTGYGAPLWRFDRDRAGANPKFGHSGGGVRLRRVDRNGASLVLSNSRRVPIAGPLTLTGLYRTSAGEGAELLVNWYPNTSTSAIGTDSRPLPATGGEWRRVTRDLRPPELATHANLVVRLAPPDSGSHSLDVDDLRLIEWADGADSGRGYDHLRPTGEATVRFRVPDDREQGSSWYRLPRQ